MKRRHAASVELTGADLGDGRLSRRLLQVVESMAQAPDKSFPEACGDDDAALEATYRFLSNESVSYEAVLAPHYEATKARAKAAGEALVVHDTTEFVFKGDREGLGRVQKKLQGFMGHFALAVSADGQREALGVIGLLPVFRPWESLTAHWRTRYDDPQKESLRWGKLVEEVEERMAGTPAIHVMDREADSYELLDALCSQKQRFVIRVRAKHRRTNSGAPVGNSTQSLETIATREVQLSAHGPKYTKGTSKSAPRPARTSRTATLRIQACPVELCRPDRTELSPTLSVNLVHVSELGAPEGEEPTDWMLYSTEPITDAAAVLRIVDHYRSRWVIEEYFKALKTGCSYEKRQLSTRHALLNALAVFVPIAWTLLLLRQQSRAADDGTPRTRALTESQLKLLRAVSKRPPPENASAREILLAVARLGGHIKSNGDPGWHVLGRGLERLLSYEVGWDAATRDQS